MEKSGDSVAGWRDENDSDQSQQLSSPSGIKTIGTVIKESVDDFNGKIVSTYDFDVSITLKNVLGIINAFNRMGVIIKHVRVSELGDLYDGSQTIIYTDITKVGQIRTDFSGRVIQCYDIVGYYDTYKIVASIYPMANRLIISYPPQIKSLIDNMIGSISNQPNK